MNNKENALAQQFQCGDDPKVRTVKAATKFT